MKVNYWEVSKKYFLKSTFLLKVLLNKSIVF